MDRGAWRAAAHGVTKSRTQLKQLSRHQPHPHRYFSSLTVSLCSVVGDVCLGAGTTAEVQVPACLMPTLSR